MPKIWHVIRIRIDYWWNAETIIIHQDLWLGKLVPKSHQRSGERGGSVVECRTPEREVRGSRPTAAVLCPWARHFTPRKYWLITQEAMAPSRHDWKIVDWDVKPQHNQQITREVNLATQSSATSADEIRELGEDIPIPDSLGEEATLINLCISNGGLKCLWVLISTMPSFGKKVICWYTGFTFETFI